MPQSKGATMTTEPPTESLGVEGEGCTACGSALASDQRYCLNCGEARAEPRLDFQQHLNPAAAAPTGAAATPSRSTAGMQWNPIVAIGAIALLGVMLLLGVLIGKDENDTTVAAAPATTTTTAAPATPAPTDTTAAAPAADKAAKGGKAAKGAGSGPVVQGGTGSTEGVSTENPLEGLTGDQLAEAQKNAPDVIATEGTPPPVDKEPAGGGSGGGTCIGC